MMRYRDGSKMDPVRTDRCVIVVLNDAFGRFQNNRIPPTPFAYARWGLPCHFKRSGSDKWLYYTNPKYSCHREFNPNRVWFYRTPGDLIVRSGAEITLQGNGGLL